MKKIILLTMLLSFLLPTQIHAAAGDLDSTFNSGSPVQSTYSSSIMSGFGQPIDVDSQGRTYIAVTSGSLSDFTVLRYKDDGSIDSDFGTSGAFSSGFIDGGGNASRDVPMAINVIDDDLIVVGGLSLIHI